MSQSKPYKKQASTTTTELHAASVNENGVLADAVYPHRDSTPVQFAVFSNGQVSIAPTVVLEGGKTILPPLGAFTMASNGVVVLPSGCFSYGSQSDLLNRSRISFIGMRTLMIFGRN